MSLIRPVFDFAAVVYHSMMTGEQKHQLERLQARALTIISGTKASYRQNSDDLGIETLDNRRLALVDKFLAKTLEHPHFGEKWFPRKERNPYSTRHEEIFIEYRCNTERNRSNPLNFFRRRLNGH